MPKTTDRPTRAHSGSRHLTGADVIAIRRFFDKELASGALTLKQHTTDEGAPVVSLCEPGGPARYGFGTQDGRVHCLDCRDGKDGELIAEAATLGEALARIPLRSYAL